MCHLPRNLPLLCVCARYQRKSANANRQAFRAQPSRTTRSAKHICRLQRRVGRVWLRVTRRIPKTLQPYPPRRGVAQGIVGAWPEGLERSGTPNSPTRRVGAVAWRTVRHEPSDATRLPPVGMRPNHFPRKNGCEAYSTAASRFFLKKFLYNSYKYRKRPVHL